MRDIIPWLAYYASDEARTDRTMRHEAIHGRQQKEMLIIFFYIWYGIEWLVKLIKYGSQSYNNISFEREAYRNANDQDYLKKRKLFIWAKYL